MSLNNIIKIPASVQSIIETLNENGHKAFVVGGCVRDSLLGRTPDDFDICTGARPQEVKSLFSQTYDTGIQHGTVTVVIDGQNFEVTTFRSDGEYKDNRKPEAVSFLSSIDGDLSRRDFTINAMAYHPLEGLIDPFNGSNDLKAQILRTVGNPDKRFSEDALRMLRAVRFAAQLNFTIEVQTLSAIKENSFLISKISHERIRLELTKLLLSSHPEKLIILKETRLIKYLLPEFMPCFQTSQNNPYHVFDVARHTIAAIQAVPKDTVLRWTMLLHDIGKPQTKITDDKNIDHFYGHPLKSLQISEKILERLKFDNKTKNRILRLVKHHDRTIEPVDAAIRKAIKTIGEDIFSNLLKVKEADIRAQNPDFLRDRLEKLNKIHSKYLDIKEKRQCLSLDSLAVNGQDLISLGIEPGETIGRILSELLDAVLDNPEINYKEKLSELAILKYNHQ